MLKFSKLFWIILAILIVGAGLDIFILAKQSANEKTITSYAECVAENNIITQSYPAQCRTKDGQIFVQPLTDEEKEALKPPLDGAACKNQCGDGQCAEIVCLAIGCPCAETPQTCPADCRPINLGTATVSGHLNIGPFCPVMREGELCPVPVEAYTSRAVLVYDITGKNLIAKKSFDTNGNYSLSLAPGTYLIQIDEKSPFYQKAPEKITLKNGQTLTHNFDVDTGIR